MNQIKLIAKDTYALVVMGEFVFSGSEREVIEVAKQHHFTDLDLAFQVCKDSLDTVMDFGVNRSFIISLTPEKQEHAS